MTEASSWLSRGSRYVKALLVHPTSVMHLERSFLQHEFKSCLPVQSLEGEEVRRERERTTPVLAALQQKCGLTGGTLQAMEVEAKIVSRPKGTDKRASVQQGRRGLQVGYTHSTSLLAV
jgi:hypothetical protein